MQLETQLRAAGAKVYSAGELRKALHLAHHPALSAAVLDYRLGPENIAAVCRRLTYLGVPFMFYSGYPAPEAFGEWPDAPVMAKPADEQALLNAVAGLLH
jgi:DNA-binding response OmpR family regulator